MPASAMRQKSWAACGALHLPSNPSLPELEPDLSIRSTHQIADRALSLAAVVAVAFGLPRHRASDWLTSENLTESLSPHERAFVTDGEGVATQFQRHADSLFAFAWVLGIVDSFDFVMPAPKDLVRHFPDLRNGESSRVFRSRIVPRSTNELVPIADAGYCIAWACREEKLQGRATVANLSTVDERRRSIEWALSKVKWEEVALDT